MSPYHHIHFNDLDAIRLTAFIAGRYHSLLRGLGTVIADQLSDIEAGGSPMVQEWRAIGGLFRRLHEDLSVHVRKEQYVLFPYVRQEFEEGAATSRPKPVFLMGSVLQQMRREHRQFTETTSQIRRLSNNYTPSAEECATARLCLAALAEFERELEDQIHLENNILFPKLIALEEGKAVREASEAGHDR